MNGLAKCKIINEPMPVPGPRRDGNPWLHKATYVAGLVAGVLLFGIRYSDPGKAFLDFLRA